MGINVSRERTAQEAKVFGLVRAAHGVLTEESGLESGAVRCYDKYVGPGYAQPSDKMVEAVQFLAQREAVLLDRVYTGKAMTGLIGLTKKGVFSPGDRVLFLHTGGAPALYAMADAFFDPVSESGSSLGASG